MTVDFFLPSFFSLLTQPNFNWHPFFLFFNCNLYSFDCFLFILDPILIDLLFNFISLRLVLILLIAFIFLYPFLIKFNFQFHHLTFYFYIRLILIRLVLFFLLFFLISFFNVGLIMNWTSLFFYMRWFQSHDPGHKYKMLTWINIEYF